MGGHALASQGVITKRLNTKEFLEIGDELQLILKDDLDLETSIVKCYHKKKDHGDLDLLVRTNFGMKIDFRLYINETFKPRAIYYNGGVYSFDYQDFQIDLILIPEDKFEMAKLYFGFDPLSNVLGKTYHKFGLSYGWNGLTYKFRSFNGKNNSDIIISMDARRIFKFGGFDYDRYLNGFDTWIDIFKFIINSKYFNSESYQLENLSQTDRKRNRKRKSFNVFLEYINSKIIDNQYQFLPKDEYIQQINDYFPEAHFIEKLNELKRLDKISQRVADKFNGNVIMEWFPELKGKELGDVIFNHKERLGEYYNEYVLYTNLDEIKKHFQIIYDEYLLNNIRLIK